MAVLDKSLQALLKMAHKKLLWENANTSSDFPAQTITVPDISKYDFYVVFYSFDTKEQQLSSAIGMTGHGTYLLTIAKAGYGRRYLAAQNGDTLNIQAGRYAGVDGNQYQIPWYIYGVNIKGGTNE